MLPQFHVKGSPSTQRATGRNLMFSHILQVINIYISVNIIIILLLQQKNNIKYVFHGHDGVSLYISWFPALMFCSYICNKKKVYEVGTSTGREKRMYKMRYPASELLLTWIFHCVRCFCSIWDWMANRGCWGASWYTRRRVVHSNSYPFIIITGKQLCKIQLTHERICSAGSVYEPYVHGHLAMWRPSRRTTHFKHFH